MVAQTLWPDFADTRAAGCLRTALWRLRRACNDVVCAERAGIGLRSTVVVDVQVACEWAGRLIDGTATEHDLRKWPGDHRPFDLLPGWYDDWVIFDRERVRQRMLHGLEALSRRLVADGRSAEAIEPALAAVDVEPLRESSQRALIQAHLADGNLVEARRAFDLYRTVLRNEMGLSPSEEIRQLLSSRRIPAQRQPVDQDKRVEPSRQLRPSAASG